MGTLFAPEQRNGPRIGGRFSVFPVQAVRAGLIISAPARR
jgi:hypothetical protein